MCKTVRVCVCVFKNNLRVKTSVCESVMVPFEASWCQVFGGGAPEGAGLLSLCTLIIFIFQFLWKGWGSGVFGGGVGLFFGLRSHEQYSAICFQDVPDTLRCKGGGIALFVLHFFDFQQVNFKMFLIRCNIFFQ